MDQLAAGYDNGDHELILDCEAISFAGASFLALIAGACHHHMHVTVRHPPPIVLRILDVSGFTAQVTIEP